MKTLEKYLVPLIFVLMFVSVFLIHKRLDNIETQIKKIEQSKTK